MIWKPGMLSINLLLNTNLYHRLYYHIYAVIQCNFKNKTKPKMFKLPMINASVLVLLYQIFFLVYLTIDFL